MDEMRQYALLSQGSYGSKPVENYTVDGSLSNQNRTVYFKTDDPTKAVISFRGTDVVTNSNRWKDIGTDTLLALGFQDVSSRFQNALKATKDVIAKYGRNNVIATGTSLGGAQGIYVSQKLGIPAIVYNPGVSPLDVSRSKNTFLADSIAGLVEDKSGAKITAYSTLVDGVSSLVPFVRGIKTIPVKPKLRNTHSILNFL